MITPLSHIQLFSLAIARPSIAVACEDGLSGAANGPWPPQPIQGTEVLRHLGAQVGTRSGPSGLFVCFTNQKSAQRRCTRNRLDNVMALGGINLRHLLASYSVYQNTARTLRKGPRVHRF